MLASKKGFEEILTLVPKVAFAAAYGSAVMKQEGYSGSKMVDYIFAVDNPKEWHGENFKMNGYQHYSLLAGIGPGLLSTVQGLGAGVYFNVPKLPTGEAKYAVVEKSLLCSELRDWKNLYISGRLQKPVCVIVDDSKVHQAREENLKHALNTALLLLPNRFTELELFTAISVISYTGDPRMGLGEHPDKPKQIASGQTPLFRDLYAPTIEASSWVLFRASSSSAQFEQDYSPQARGRLFGSLPQSVIDFSASSSIVRPSIPPKFSRGEGDSSLRRQAVVNAVEANPTSEKLHA